MKSKTRQNLVSRYLNWAQRGGKMPGSLSDLLRQAKEVREGENDLESCEMEVLNHLSLGFWDEMQAALDEGITEDELDSLDSVVSTADPAVIGEHITEAIDIHKKASVDHVRTVVAEFIRSAAAFRESMIPRDKPWNPKNETYAKRLNALAAYVEALPDDDQTLRRLSECKRLYDYDDGFSVPESEWQHTIHCYTEEPAVSFQQWAVCLLRESREVGSTGKQ